LYDGAEEERIKLRMVCAGSAWRMEDFLYNERAAAAFPMALSFAVHPQLPAACKRDSYNASDTVEALTNEEFPANRDAWGYAAKIVQDSLSLLNKLAGEKRIDAVGETGFDLFNREFRATEELQDELFREHLSAAEKYGLPLVLHIRRAIQKIFLYAGRLKNIPSVVFHSYSGTAEDAASILRRGINAYFSFGAAILLNHKKAMKTCATLDAERLLFETDAPYQSPAGREFSSYADIYQIIEQAAHLRREAGRPCTKAGLEKLADENFYKVYGKRPL
jgi:TatD DNase family protein